MAIGTILGKILGTGAKQIGLEKILDVGTRWIPDKEGQLELEKQLLEVNQEIIKSNKTLMEKVVPITFPCCVWILSLYAIVNLVIGAYTLLKNGTAGSIPFPDIICQLSLIFACAIGGKWNIKEFKKK